MFFPKLQIFNKLKNIFVSAQNVVAADSQDIEKSRILELLKDA